MVNHFVKPLFYLLICGFAVAKIDLISNCYSEADFNTQFAGNMLKPDLRGQFEASSDILGEGSFGIVKAIPWKTNANEQIVVAVKKIKVTEPGLVKQLAKEIEILKKLEKEPDIMHMYGCMQGTDITHEYVNFYGRYEKVRREHTNIYLILEKLHGDFEESSKPTSPFAKLKDLPLDKKMEVYLKIIKALRTLHKAEFVHSDFKPANVMTADPEFKVLKLIDMGLAGRINEFQVGSSPLYSPYEGFIDSYLSPSFDVYGFGISIASLELGAKNLENAGIKYFKTNKKTFVDKIYRYVSSDLPKLPGFESRQIKGVNDGLSNLVIDCMNYDRFKRPGSDQVISRLTAIIENLQHNIAAQLAAKAAAVTPTKQTNAAVPKVEPIVIKPPQVSPGIKVYSPKELPKIPSEVQPQNKIQENKQPTQNGPNPPADGNNNVRVERKVIVENRTSLSDSQFNKMLQAAENKVRLPSVPIQKVSPALGTGNQNVGTPANGKYNFNYEVKKAETSKQALRVNDLSDRVFVIPGKIEPVKPDVKLSPNQAANLPPAGEINGYKIHRPMLDMQEPKKVEKLSPNELLKRIQNLADLFEKEKPKLQEKFSPVRAGMPIQTPSKEVPAAKSRQMENLTNHRFVRKNITIDNKQAPANNVRYAINEYKAPDYDHFTRKAENDINHIKLKAGRHYTLDNDFENDFGNNFGNDFIMNFNIPMLAQHQEEGLQEAPAVKLQRMDEESELSVKAELPAEVPLEEPAPLVIKENSVSPSSGAMKPLIIGSIGLALGLFGLAFWAYSKKK
jgi:serine/threonine protein kinase